MGPFFLNKLFIMQKNALICPTCSGQMMLTEVRPGDKIAKCGYCNTIVDLPETAEKENFNSNNFNNSNTGAANRKPIMIVILAVVVLVVLMGTIAIFMTVLQQ